MAYWSNNLNCFRYEKHLILLRCIICKFLKSIEKIRIAIKELMDLKLKSKTIPVNSSILVV